MTAQIGDVYKYREKEYTIVDMTNPLNFHPKDYGLTPNNCCTACWKGFWCDYNLDGDVLTLENLYMYNDEENYPPINGVEVSPPTFIEAKGYSGKSNKLQTFKMPAFMGHRLYPNVNLEIPYTGHILVGNDFISEYYIHMGYQQGWGYRHLLEFVFEEGLLVDCIDHSHIARHMRHAMKQMGINSRFPPSSDIAKCLEPFLSDDSVDLWWINGNGRHLLW